MKNTTWIHYVDLFTAFLFCLRKCEYVIVNHFQRLRKLFFRDERWKATYKVPKVKKLTKPSQKQVALHSVLLRGRTLISYNALKTISHENLPNVCAGATWFRTYVCLVQCTFQKKTKWQGYGLLNSYWQKLSLRKASLLEVTLNSKTSKSSIKIRAVPSKKPVRAKLFPWRVVPVLNQILVASQTTSSSPMN